MMKRHGILNLAQHYMRLIVIGLLSIGAIVLFVMANRAARDAWLKNASTEELEAQARTHRDDGLLVRTLCYRLVDNGEYDKALQLMESLVALHPSSSEDWLGLAKCASRANRVARAFYAYKKTYELDPNNAQALLFAGQIEAHAGLYTDGLQDMETALRIAPKLDIDHTTYASCLWHTGQWQKAWQQLQIAANQTPMSDEVYSDLVKVARHVGEIPKAEDLLRRRLSMTPAYDPPKIHGLLALALLYEAHSPQDLLNAADEASKESWMPLRYQAGAEILLAGHDIDHALELTMKGLKASPANVSLLRLLQRIYIQQHKIAEAQAVAKRMALAEGITPQIQQLQEAAAKYPQDISLQQQLAQALLQQGNYAQAAEALHRVLHLKPNDPAMLQLLEKCRLNALEQLELNLTKHAHSLPTQTS